MGKIRVIRNVAQGPGASSAVGRSPGSALRDVIVFFSTGMHESGSAVLRHTPTSRILRDLGASLDGGAVDGQGY